MASPLPTPASVGFASAFAGPFVRRAVLSFFTPPGARAAAAAPASGPDDASPLAPAVAVPRPDGVSAPGPAGNGYDPALMAKKTTTSRPAASARPASADPYAGRLARLRAAFAGSGADAMLITGPKDVGYLTGFHGGDSYLLVPASGKPIVISDFRYQEELEEVKHLARIKIRKGAILEATAEAVASVKAASLAVQGEHLTVAGLDGLKDQLKKTAGFRAKAIIPTVGIVLGLRTVKDAHEIRLIKQAVRVAEEALLATLPTIAPGQTESEVAGRLEQEMKARGASAPGFESIVAARANGSLPHYRPSSKVKLAANQPLLIDWGATVDAYHSDMTRTFALGRWPARVREIYEIVLDAHEKSAAALRPGVSGREIDLIARNHIKRHGYGKHFGHGLGHGVGLDGHEMPRLSHMAPDDPLEPGQVVTIEPGIYLPGVGGVRIEDDYLITENGAMNLCTLPRTLEWSTLR